MNNPNKKQNGAITIMVAVMLIMLIGFMGLSIDVGFLLLIKNKLQNTADAMSLACVIKNDPNACGKLSAPYYYHPMNKTTGYPDLDAVSDPQLINVNPSAYNVSVIYPYPDPTLSTCPNDGVDCAKVVVSTEINPFFMNMLQRVQTPIKISASAVAGTPLAVDCILVQDQMTMQVNSTIKVNNCNVDVGSAASPKLGAIVSNGSNAKLNVTGGVTTIYNSGTDGCGANCAPQAHIRSQLLTVPDSYKSVTAPHNANLCQKNGTGGLDSQVSKNNHRSYNPGLYCNEIKISNNDEVTFKSGNYTLNNGMTITGGHVTTSGEHDEDHTGNFFYINNPTNGKKWISITGGDIDLWARDSHNCTSNSSGMLFYVNAANSPTADVSFAGNSGMKLYGNLDFYNASVKINGTGSNIIQGAIVAYDLTISGNWNLTATGCSPLTKLPLRLLQ